MTYTLDPPLPPTATPKDYHRLLFDPVDIPDKRIVGLLACQRDPLLQTLRTKVTSIKRSAGIIRVERGKKKSSKPDTNGNGNGTIFEKGLWEIETEDTVIFPEGGGQPSDTGSLTFEDPNGGEVTVRVEECVRRKLGFVHIVRVSEGEDGEGLLERLDGEDAGGREVQPRVDWERRMDQMSLHTAQHLLSAILDTYNLPTLSWALPPHPSLDPPYIELPRGLTWSEVEEVEKKCNGLIEEGRKVWIDVDRQKDGEFGRVTLGGEDEVRGIPRDYEGGVIRVVNIDSIDKNACCGTQLPNLTQCGFVHIIPPSTPSTATIPTSTVPTRLFFTAGPRAIRYLAQQSRNISLATQIMSVGRTDLVERVGKLYESRVELLGREKDIRSEFGKMLGESVIMEGGVGWVKRDNSSTHDFDFSGLIATTWGMASNRNKTDVLIVTSSSSGVSSALVLVQSADNDSAKKVNERIKAALEKIPVGGAEGDEQGKGKGPRVKGGGAKGRFMSKVEGRLGKRELEAIEGVLAGGRYGLARALDRGPPDGGE